MTQEMKDCVICGAMIPFYGPDICQDCRDRIAAREKLTTERMVDHSQGGELKEKEERKE